MTLSGITFIMYAHNRKIAKRNNLEVFLEQYS